MLKIYKQNKQERVLRTLRQPATYSWIVAIAPSMAEQTKLSHMTDITSEMIEDALDLYEVPHITSDQDRVHLVVRVPAPANTSRATVPVSLIITKKIIATIAPTDTPLLADIRTGSLAVPTTHQSRFVISILHRCVQDYEKKLAQLTRSIDREKDLTTRITKKDILALVLVEEVLNDYLAALMPTIAAMKKMVHGGSLPLYQNDIDIVDELLIDAEQVKELCLSNLKTVRNIRDGYTTVLSLGLNQIMKVLTYITAIFTIPMVIASFFGMNVPLPIAAHDNAFGGIVLISVLAMSTAIGVFLWWRSRV